MTLPNDESKYSLTENEMGVFSDMFKELKPKKDNKEDNKEDNTLNDKEDVSYVFDDKYGNVKDKFLLENIANQLIDTGIIDSSMRYEFYKGLWDMISFMPEDKTTFLNIVAQSLTEEEEKLFKKNLKAARSVDKKSQKDS